MNDEEKFAERAAQISKIRNALQLLLSGTEELCSLHEWTGLRGLPRAEKVNFLRVEMRDAIDRITAVCAEIALPETPITPLPKEKES